MDFLNIMQVHHLDVGIEGPGGGVEGVLKHGGVYTWTVISKNYGATLTRIEWYCLLLARLTVGRLCV